MGVLVDETLPSQKIAAFISVALSLIALIVTYTYWAQRNNGTGWLGSISNKCTVHAVLMITGFGFTYTQAIVSYRLFTAIVGHEAAKILHGFWNTSTIILAITAIVKIVSFHNEENWGHLTTMHSWLAIFLLAIYSQNWVFGIIHFIFPVSIEWKKRYLPSHRFFGIVGILLAAVVMETGIAQKNWIDDSFGCIYSFSGDFPSKYKEDPATGYNLIHKGCRASFGIGILLIFNAAFAVYSLWDFRPVEEREKDKPYVELPPVDAQEKDKQGV